MSYHRRARRGGRAMHGIQSRAPGAPVSMRALAPLSGVQSRAPGAPVSLRALGAPPDWYRAMQGPPDWYAAMQGTTLGDDTLNAMDPATTSVDTMSEAEWRQAMLEEQQAVRLWQERWVKADEMQRWIQIAVTASIPLFTAIWKMLGIGKRFSGGG